MDNWYPKSDADVMALPEAPKADWDRFWAPVLGVGQVLRVDSQDDGVITLAGKIDSNWVRVVLRPTVNGS